jgi:hypothetical protein
VTSLEAYDPVADSGGPAQARARLRYGIIAILTAAVGMAVHLHAGWLPHAIHDMLGDALWAATVYWMVSVAVPRARRRWRLIAALGICIVVELSQLWHPQWLDSVRDTLAGHLLLGSDFDPRDLLAYAIGVLAAVMVDGRTPAR